ncbi:M20/M25/M40 family metallo-hydrolase [Nocardia sp. NBC_01327]|uniref:M20/M25/M40 family metallo-hydrolase n=1 Tax=Nocardia sp. NBC_01327 TaxID=2903593 RepID=UPI002E1169F4|nr:M20/M25/M40 family metallo-hydrolase [Nocardia sp. NBC_01327]
MGNEHHTLELATAMMPTMLKQLGELVECESPSNSPEALRNCAQLLAPWLEKALGRPVDLVWSGENVHLVAQAQHPRVLVVGHFDTVWPLGTITEWRFEISDDGIATGPGVFDMKAGIVQLLAALELMVDASAVSVVLTSDEETGSATSWPLIEQQAKLAGVALVCEPSADGGAVKVARKGIANYQVKVHGKAAHSGLEPALGVNAGVELAHQILAINNLGSGDTTVTPTMFSAGTATNVVPEFAMCHVDVRAWTRSDLEDVDDAMAALKPHVEGARVVVEGGIERPPFEPALGVNVFADAAAAAWELGLAPLAATRSAGGSDANLIAAIGVPTLDGLGALGAHPHGRGERVDVTVMGERAALLSTLLHRLSNRSPGR